jgi:hypothetical protein
LPYDVATLDGGDSVPSIVKKYSVGVKIHQKNTIQNGTAIDETFILVSDGIGFIISSGEKAPKQKEIQLEETKKYHVIIGKLVAINTAYTCTTSRIISKGKTYPTRVTWQKYNFRKLKSTRKMGNLVAITLLVCQWQSDTLLGKHLMIFVVCKSKHRAGAWTFSRLKTVYFELPTTI